ncbi:hypothetical protein U9M48_019593 [Paspalum notatum var. saurae]|uniref:Integrase catalytic domain-containing protein n=1 Tax=Paspalum notatum var. saurae TaxID=547442 RepID=A0AAQ3TBN6_PASNO
MDFIEGLPRVNAKTVILTVVDRFSKLAHFIPLAHPYTAITIVRLHGIPSSIVSDHDPVFTSAFWRELFRLSGVQLNMSSAYHPQSDGQSEATNGVISMYLRCLTGDRPRQWLQWLAWAEYCYNSSFQTSLGTTPFRVVYGQDPPSFRPYDGASARLPVVEFLAAIQDRFEQAQQYQKLQHDRRHHEVIFAPGQWVWLFLLHRPAASITCTVAANLDHDSSVPSKFRSVWAMLLIASSCLKAPRFMILTWVSRRPPTDVPDLPPIHHGRVYPVPQKVLRGRLARGVPKVLVQCQGQSAADVSKVSLEEFRRLYPTFQLEDELIVQAGRDVMYGQQYQ